MPEQLQNTTFQRGSISNRISQLWSRRHQPSTIQSSNRTSNACEVPIFMSPSQDDDQHRRLPPQNTEFLHSPRGDATTNLHVPALSIASSSVYSASPRHEQEQHVDTFEEQSYLEAAESSVQDEEETVSHTSTTHSDVQQLIDRRKRRRRVRESTRRKIEGKKRLSMAFGITVLATGITCMNSHLKTLHSHESSTD